MSKGQVHSWNELPADQPMPKITRQRVIGRQAMISRVILEQGCDVPAHAHENEQFAHIVRGAIRFGLGEPGSDDYEERVVRGGEVLQLPAWLKHSAYALEETEVLDIFAPPSEETGIDS